MSLNVSPAPTRAADLTDGTVGTGAIVLKSYADTLSAPALFYQVMSPKPTSASTGLNTWLNQGSATVVDTATGICIYDSGTGTSQDALRIRKKGSVPSTPYTITALLAMGGYGSDYATAGIGWYDGSAKLQTINLSSGGNYFTVQVLHWADPTSVAAGGDASLAGGFPGLYWLQITDDGTNAIFKCSQDGAHFTTVYSIDKASGYLGSSGYSNLIFLLDANSSTGTAEISATLMQWNQT